MRLTPSVPLLVQLVPFGTGGVPFSTGGGGTSRFPCAGPPSATSLTTLRRLLDDDLKSGGDEKPFPSLEALFPVFVSRREN